MPITPQKLVQLKQQARPIVTLTAADYPTAQLLDQAGVDIILVGDSLAMVYLGHPNTLPLTLDEMLHHTRAVRRGVHNALVVCDLPFMSYQESTAQAIHNAGRALKEAGADAVKLEGATPEMLEIVNRLTHIGIPVMGHVGLTPQSVKLLGLRQQGKTAAEGDRILAEAIALEAAGAFAVVLEHIPADLARQISQKLSVPTIGIGAGPDCDGQVLVTADLLGLSEQLPPFAKVYASLRTVIGEAVSCYAQEVRARNFHHTP